MNTETGRIYPPEEYQLRSTYRPPTVGAEFDKLDDHQAQFMVDLRAGKIAEVSERVARQQVAGQRVEEKRRKKAAKAARKKSR